MKKTKLALVVGLLALSCVACGGEKVDNDEVNTEVGSDTVVEGNTDIKDEYEQEIENEIFRSEVTIEDFDNEELFKVKAFENNDRISLMFNTTCQVKAGPSEEYFANGSLYYEGTTVTVIGYVDSFNGEACNWYVTVDGEFVNPEYLSTYTLDDVSDDGE